VNPIKPHLEVKFISSKKGKGLFAKVDILEGEIIDIAHIILISNKDWNLIKNTVLVRYIFEWDDPQVKGKYDSMISLSISQFINHSYNPNANYSYDYENKCVEYFAIRDIPAKSEITVNYNGDPSDETPMWFEVE